MPVLGFEYWHVKSVTNEDWQAMLGVACGLCRSADGVLYRRLPGLPASFVQLDFS